MKRARPNFPNHDNTKKIKKIKISGHPEQINSPPYFSVMIQLNKPACKNIQGWYQTQNQILKSINIMYAIRQIKRQNLFSHFIIVYLSHPWLIILSTPPLSAGGVEPPTKFSKKVGLRLTGPQLLEGGNFFQEGCNCHIKIQTGKFYLRIQFLLKDKMVLRMKNFNILRVY